MVDISHLKPMIEKTLEEFKGREQCDDPRGAFVHEMAGQGYHVRRDDIVVGRVGRIDAPGEKKGKRSGWYWYDEFDDNYNEGYVIGYGQFGSWKEGDASDSKHTWSSRNNDLLTREQKHDIEQARKAARKAREIEQDRTYQQVAAECWNIWESASEPKEHEYLKRKQVQGIGLRQQGERLIVPMTNDKGELTSLQYIWPDGKKRYHTGGKVKGAYHIINGMTDTIYIAEGYATAVSIHMATGKTVVCAFTCHKLLDSSNFAKSRWPESMMVLAGDNDDVGSKKAKEIAQALKLVCKLPECKGSDFNDLHVEKGLPEVKSQLEREYDVYAPEIDETNTPSHLMNPPGILGDMVNYYRLTDKRANDILALPAAIALASLITARNYETDMGNRASLFLLSVAKTGAGKEHCDRVIKNILNEVDMLEYGGVNGYKSGSAVFSKCLEMPRHLSIVNEFGVFLDSMNHKNASSHAAQTKGALLEVSTKLTGYLTPPAYATKGMKKEERSIFNQQVVHPAVTMLATTTPEIYNQITKDMVADGFLNRFIIVVSDEPMNYLKMTGKHEVPQSIISWIKEINDRKPNIPEIATEAPEVIEVPFSTAATEVISEFERYNVDMINGIMKDNALKEMLPRCTELSMRLALIVALGCNPNTKEITKEHAQWAVDFVKYHSSQTIKHFQRTLADSPYERKKMQWLSAIRDKGAEGIEHRELPKVKPFSAEKKRDQTEILVDLLEAGLIAEGQKEAEGRGRPAKFYYAVKSVNK